MLVCYKDHIFGRVDIMTTCLCFWSRNICTYNVIIGIFIIFLNFCSVWLFTLSQN